MNKAYFKIALAATSLLFLAVAYINVTSARQYTGGEWKKTNQLLVDEQLVTPVLSAETRQVVGLYQPTKQWSWSPFGSNKAKIKTAQVIDGVITASAYDVNETSPDRYDGIWKILINPKNSKSTSLYEWKQVKTLDITKIKKITEDYLKKYGHEMYAYGSTLPPMKTVDYARFQFTDEQREFYFFDMFYDVDTEAVLLRYHSKVRNRLNTGKLFPDDTVILWLIVDPGRGVVTKSLIGRYALERLE